MRRVKTVVIDREGRDKGGVFELEEMPAMPATDWLMRAGQLLARAGTNVPADIAEHGVTGFLALGMGAVASGLGNAPWGEAKPLLDQLLGCVRSYTPPGGKAALTGWGLIQQQIEEPNTIFQLYEEALSLTMGFSIAAALSDWGLRLMGIVRNALGPITETSSESAPSSSAPATPD